MLSNREDEVARLAATGFSNRAIATRLHLSVRTVDNHLHHTYEKLGISGRDELPATLKPEVLPMSADREEAWRIRRSVHVAC
jgi:DNA-binding NarL/FixJ family response regulator